MQRCNETISKIQFDNNYKTGIKNWGDQVDIVLKKTEIIQDKETYYSIEFLRCSKLEFENLGTEQLKERIETQNYADIEFLQKKIENQSKAIELLVEILEDENE